jgi:hypothetical protein
VGTDDVKQAITNIRREAKNDVEVLQLLQNAQVPSNLTRRSVQDWLEITANLTCFDIRNTMCSAPKKKWPLLFKKS